MRMIKFRLRIGSEIVGYELFSSSTVGGGWFYLDIKALNPHWKREQGVPDSYIYHTEKDQYTALHDKNGKKIYEGDIVRIYEEDEESPSGIIHEHLGFIYWHEKECRYKYGTKKQKVLGEKDWHDYSEFPSYMCEHEVIGNIYENPELLKG